MECTQSNLRYSGFFTNVFNNTRLFCLSTGQFTLRVLSIYLISSLHIVNFILVYPIGTPVSASGTRSSAAGLKAEGLTAMYIFDGSVSFNVDYILDFLTSGGPIHLPINYRNSAHSPFYHNLNRYHKAKIPIEVAKLILGVDDYFLFPPFSKNLDFS